MTYIETYWGETMSPWLHQGGLYRQNLNLSDISTELPVLMKHLLFFLEDFKIEILIENRNPIFPANFFVSATPLCCQAFVLSHDPASKHYTRLCFRSNASAAIHFRVQSAVNYRTKRDLIYWFFRVVHVGLVDYRACERTVSLVLLYNEGMNLVFLLVILFF